MLYQPNPQDTTAPTVVSVPPRRVRIRDIRRLRSKAARAEIAADLISGKATLNLDPQTMATFCDVIPDLHHRGASDPAVPAGPGVAVPVSVRL